MVDDFSAGGFRLVDKFVANAFEAALDRILKKHLKNGDTKNLVPQTSYLLSEFKFS